MNTDSAIQSWGTNTWRNAKQVLHLARNRSVEVTIELFSPERRCPVCHLSSAVFVRPHRSCAHCWSAFGNGGLHQPV